MPPEPTAISIPTDLLPADGRFGCGPSKVRPEQVVPRSLEDVFGVVKNAYPPTSLVVGVQRRARGVSLAGHVVNHLPSSALVASAMYMKPR